jgi:serine/threonine-protein kinase
VQPGDEIAGRYRLEELHGRGSMSEVWRAHDQTLDRTVALKILSPTADLERFRREARSLAGLAHENVMRVFDYGEDAAGPFMALEWLPRGTLEDGFEAGGFAPAEIQRIAHGIAAGLAHLHSRGLVHRDLKPANVLFDDEGRPKLGDFGLVRHAVGSGTLTEAGTLLGTAAYISPEQASGEPAGPASDVYSFGVILFRMLTGLLPFAADDPLALMELHRHEPAPDPAELNPGAPPGLAALTAATLRKDPAVRPQDGTALLVALDAAPVPIEPVPESEQTQILPGPRRPARRTTRLTTAAGIALVLLAAGGVLAWAVARPPSTAPGNAPTDSVAGTGRSRQPGSTARLLPTAGTTRTRQTHTDTRKRSTTQHSTNGVTTAPTAPGFTTTTTPTTTQSTTTSPTTTAPTTTTTSSTTTPATTSTTSTSSTTTVAGTTTTA